LSRLRENLPARSDTEVIRMALELLEGTLSERKTRRPRKP
jgi:hypothetical protein